MPNDDLISRKALLEKVFTKRGDFHYFREPPEKVVRATDVIDAPAVDAEPVRHGEWITIWEDCYVGKSKAKIGHTFCSVCNSWRVDVEFKYCPNCGAKMENPT